MHTDDFESAIPDIGVHRCHRWIDAPRSCLDIQTRQRTLGDMRVAIMGNSGSGKSTLAAELARKSAAAVLDLDTIAWMPGPEIVRRPIEAVQEDLARFCEKRTDWIVEGCYGDLIKIALTWRPELILLNPSLDVCLRNCRARQWEPHKYAAKAAQNAALEFLLSWVRDYDRRDDDCSLRRHRELFDAYDGPKREITT